MNRVEVTLNSLPTEPAAEVVVFPCTLCGIVLGAAVFGFVCRRDATSGYFVFSILTCVGLLLLTTALSLDTASLKETELQHLRLNQVLRIVFLLVACAVPASAFLGWYCSQLTK